MAVTAGSVTRRRRSIPPQSRRHGPDVVRAIALIGVVVMNYHGYLILRGAEPGDGVLVDVFDPWTGPLSSRFAATFVLVAGIGVTLMTQRVMSEVADGAEGAAERLVEMRWRLARRGLMLYVLGELLDLIWRGTIIVYYGALFVLAAVLFRLTTRALVAVGAIAALSAWALNVWMAQRDLDGESVEWITDPGPGSVRGVAFDLFVNGTHPLLPWLTFFCAGMVLGRLLDARGVRAACAGLGMSMLGLSLMLDSVADTPFQRAVLSNDPFDRSAVYVVSALGTALLAYALIDGLVEWVDHRRPALVDPFRIAGQMTLTLYILHVLVFNLLVDWWGWVEPAGVGTALVFALAFWTAAIMAAGLWDERYGRGPAERVYRRLGA